MNENIPYIERIVDLNVFLDKKSRFLFGPRQTGKTFLIRHTLENVRVYDLLDSSIYLALSRNPERISGERLSYWRSKSGFEVDFIIGDHTAVEMNNTYSLP